MLNVSVGLTLFRNRLIHLLLLVWQHSCLKLPPGCLTHLSNGSSWAMRCSFWIISAASLIWKRGNKCVFERERGRCQLREEERGSTTKPLEVDIHYQVGGRRQCLHLGDHHLRAAFLHLPVFNRELITDRLRSPGHQQQQQQQSWLSSTSKSLLGWLFPEWAVIPQESELPSIICPARDICLKKRGPCRDPPPPPPPPPLLTYMLAEKAPDPRKVRCPQLLCSCRCLSQLTSLLCSREEDPAFLLGEGFLSICPPAKIS